MNKQNGTALITALFIMALCAIIATGIYWELRVSIARTRLMQLAFNKSAAFDAAKYWAISELSQSNVQQNLVFPTINISGINVSGVLSDAQGILNINDLLSTHGAQAFLTLVSLVSPNTDPATANQILSQIQLYLTFGKSHLQNYTPALNTIPNHLFITTDLLSMVTDISPELLQNLSPYIIALPEQTNLNINSLNVLMWQIVGAGITASQAQSLVNIIKQLQPLQNINNFLQNPMVSNLTLMNDLFTTQSNYFLLQIQADNGTYHWNQTVVLKKVNKNNQLNISVVYQN